MAAKLTAAINQMRAEVNAIGGRPGRDGLCTTTLVSRLRSHMQCEQIAAEGDVEGKYAVEIIRPGCASFNNTLPPQMGVNRRKVGRSLKSC